MRMRKEEQRVILMYRIEQGFIVAVRRVHFFARLPEFFVLSFFGWIEVYRKTMEINPYQPLCVRLSWWRLETGSKLEDWGTWAVSD